MTKHIHTTPWRESLTLERQMCKACWMEGKRVKLIDHAKNELRTVHPLTLRARVIRHFREHHPDWNLR